VRHDGQVGGLLRSRFARVAVVGAVSGAVDFGVFNLLLLGGGREVAFLLLANTVAFACAMVVNYTLNARFSFGVPMSRSSALRYAVFTAFGLVLYNANLLLLRWLLDADTSLMLNASKVVAMGSLLIWNYAGYRRFVFPPTEATLATGRSS
jgi:putative flippase GtrA